MARRRDGQRAASGCKRERARGEQHRRPLVPGSRGAVPYQLPTTSRGWSSTFFDVTLNGASRRSSSCALQRAADDAWWPTACGTSRSLTMDSEGVDHHLELGCAARACSATASARHAIGQSIGSLIFKPEQDRLTGRAVPQEEMRHAPARNGRASDDRWHDLARTAAADLLQRHHDAARAGRRTRRHRPGYAKICARPHRTTKLAATPSATPVLDAEERALSAQFAEVQLAMKDEFLAVVSHELKNPLNGDPDEHRSC